MEHAWIQNHETQKVEKWQPWPYLLDLFDIIEEFNLIYILKASQLGISWQMALINLWLGLFGETAKCLLFSQGQREARELLSKVFFLFRHLPEYLKLPIDNKNRESFVLKEGDVEIMALPSVADAGHGFQGTMVTRDELARHDFAKENFKAVSRSGAKLVELSTANKEDVTNYFGEKTSEFYYHPQTVKYVYPSGVELYTNPTKPGQCLVFLSWDLRPVRLEGMTLEQWWESRVVPRYTSREIEEQFPKYITDVFKASITRAYFEFSALEDMGYQLCQPIKQQEVDTFNDIIRVYKLPIKSNQYVVYTDPSDGVEDPFVTGVMDYITGEVVASAVSKVKVDFCAKIHDYLVRAYCDATNSYEYNSVGMGFAQCIETLKTPNQAPRRKPDGKVDLEKKGQFMSREFKNMMLADLAFGITKRQFVSHDREFLQQAKMVTRDDEGKPVTEKKLSFDWVMMMGGLVQLSKYVPRVKYRAYTIDI